MGGNVGNWKKNDDGGANDGYLTVNWTNSAIKLFWPVTFVFASENLNQIATTK